MLAARTGARALIIRALLFLLGLSCVSQTDGAAILVEEAYITMARCRVHCVKQFVLDKDEQDRDSACRLDAITQKKVHDTDCNKCWRMCSDVLRGILDGCKSPTSLAEETACNFTHNKYTVPAKPTDGEWKFLDDVVTEEDRFGITLTWKPPRRKATAAVGDTVASHGPIVYVLLKRISVQDPEEWEFEDQVLGTTVRLATKDVPASPKFWLLAVTDQGRIAETKFKPQTIVNEEIFDPKNDDDLATLRKSAVPHFYMEKGMCRDINVTISFEQKLEKSPKGSFHTQTISVTFRTSGLLDPQMERWYNIHLVLVDCSKAYENQPPCNLPKEHTQATMAVKDNEQGNYTFNNLYFNSIFKLAIFPVGDTQERAEVPFKTQKCELPDAMRLYKCLDQIDESELPEEPIIGERSQMEDEDKPRLYINVTSMTPESGSDHVVVNITWTPVSNQSEQTYNVTTYVANHMWLVVDMYMTSQPFVVLRLQQDMDYVVQVETRIFPYDDDRGLIIEKLHFNTSDLPMYQEPVAYRLLDYDDINQMNGIIIGVTCFIIILVLASLSAILYKKRKSFKDIIVTKATVAKSNSYKSNVGGKSDYSNQLIVFSDEWELDPTKLKFSTLLGQGAFGKVVTGYYDDQKVAIKLVREGAPISYKEDLVAEIHLMKRIGNHPNIVCLIGACTLTEPIALVMEYVPYGNLQNFLKKCRMEGDLRKRSDGTSEITYAMMQDGGEIENGVVTPADILSFARQVSMAMEYLSDKKYVHRDLAARNVLIHYNKVVKVCDFGLSRDIFNDNHYKKLTNGKLPLKWMAIESLRDRIFTTHSDVWSFGILLWEIVTMGASPYPSVALADLYFVLSTGYRMDKPSNCSDELYAIMRSCWEDEPTERPTFTQLRFMLEELLTEDRDYLVLEDIDVPITNSDNSSTPSPQSLSAEQTSSATEAEAGAEAVSRPYPMMHGAQDPSTPAASHPVKIPKKAAPRRDHMRINVCVHQKSTDRLIRPSESDSSPSSC